MGHVTLTGLTKTFAGGSEAVKSIDLEIAEGDVMVLVGPSGCGKTTTLRMVAGLETITSGTVAIDGRVVNDVSPRDRDIAMVFQNYALYPHMSVQENMGFSLKLRKTHRGVITEKVTEASRILGLVELLARRPAQLSGGQRQRVAMGRAIVREPQVFLMDEPLSNLDAKLRIKMRAEILRILRRVGVTTMYVTHDQVEAMTMGDVVAVMRHGVIEQLDAPRDLYDRPATAFVAAFVGSPAMNLAEAMLTVGDGKPAVSLGDVEVPLPPEVLDERPRLREYDGRAVLVGIRPEDIGLDAAAPHRTTLPVKVDLLEALGSDALVHFAINARGAAIDEENDDASLELEGLGQTTFVARLPGSTRLPVAGRMDLAIDSTTFHFFDRDSGQAIRA
jgi:multiple sugar transport system ATP-binding protein